MAKQGVLLAAMRSSRWLTTCWLTLDEKEDSEYCTSDIEVKLTGGLASVTHSNLMLVFKYHLAKASIFDFR